MMVAAPTTAQRLKDNGWSADSAFKSRGTVLQKNNVVVVLGPQNASIPTRDIQLFGGAAT